MFNLNTNPLESELDVIRAEREALEAVARVKWQAVEESRKHFRALPASKQSSTDTPEFKAAEQANNEHAEVAMKLAHLDARRDAIFKNFIEKRGGEGGIIGATGEHGPGGAFRKSVGERAAGSYALTELKRSGVLDSESSHFQAKLADMSVAEVKSLITGLSDTSAGAFVSSQRAGYVGQPMRAPSVLDLVTVGQTNSDTIEYARQDTFSNVAAETAEATATDTGTKPEASLAFTKVTATVVTIAHYVNTTRRALADAGQLQMVIDQQLRYGLQLRLENEVVNGDGSGENIRGILNTSGILSQPKGSDSVADAVHKAITQLRLGYVEPTGVVMHPNDWEVVRLARDDSGASAGTGGYLYGPPSQAGEQSLWGLPVAVSTAVPDDTALVGDFRQSALWIREGAQVLASDSHSDNFIKNIVTILAEGRFAFSVLMPKGFAKVTSVD